MTNQTPTRRRSAHAIIEDNEGTVAQLRKLVQQSADNVLGEGPVHPDEALLYLCA